MSKEISEAASAAGVPQSGEELGVLSRTASTLTVAVLDAVAWAQEHDAAFVELYLDEYEAADLVAILRAQATVADGEAPANTTADAVSESETP